MNTTNKKRGVKSEFYNFTNEKFIERVRDEFEYFKSVNGHYPTSIEIDTHMPFSSKTLQRRFGTIKKLRELLGHDIIDYGSGEIRSEMCRFIVDRSYSIEHEFHGKLIEIFGNKPFVTTQSNYTNDTHIRSDFEVFHNNGSFFVDVFFGKDIHNTGICINTKNKKIKDINIDTTVYFVSLNPDITQEQLDGIVAKRKSRLHDKVIVMHVTNFIDMCKSLQNATL